MLRIVQFGESGVVDGGLPRLFGSSVRQRLRSIFEFGLRAAVSVGPDGSEEYLFIDSTIVSGQGYLVSTIVSGQLTMSIIFTIVSQTLIMSKIVSRQLSYLLIVFYN